MSPETDPHACGPESHNRADSAGVPWEGRSFESNPHAADDGSADPALLAALLRFRAGRGVRRRSSTRSAPRGCSSR